MELHNLKPAEGATKKRKRIARGQGSGHGGTSTRGHKGAKSRSGYKEKRHFEGGQMPLQMRLPKIGFKNPNRVEYKAMNLDYLQSFAEVHGLKEVTIAHLYEAGVIKKNDLVKILNRGEISQAIQFQAHACSASARQSVENAGGSIQLV
jgi:large subunit ribosomal protein L15